MPAPSIAGKPLLAEIGQARVEAARDFRLDIAHRRPPIFAVAGRQEMLFERDLFDHVLSRPCAQRSCASAVPHVGDPVSKRKSQQGCAGLGLRLYARIFDEGGRRACASDSRARTVTNDKSQVQVIARAATILRALEDESAGLSLGQIAQRVNLARSTVQRIVAALETEKLVIAATPNGRVRLGPTILRLAASVRSDFVALARPVSDAAVERTPRDRRSLDSQERSSGIHRSGDRLATAAHGVGGRRNISAVLHRERQGLSRRLDDAGDRRADRHAATSSARRKR